MFHIAYPICSGGVTENNLWFMFVLILDAEINPITAGLDNQIGWELGTSLRCMKSESESRSVMSDSLRPHGLYSPWNSPARLLKWVAFPFSRGSSQPRDQTQVSRIEGEFFTCNAGDLENFQKP